MTATTEFALLIAVAVSLCLCVVSVVFIRRVSALSYVPIRRLAIESESWSIAWKLEKSIGKHYAEFAAETEGWPESGRLAEAFRERSELYEQSKRLVLEEATERLNQLSEEAADLRMLPWFESVIESLSEQYPALGSIDTTTLKGFRGIS